MVLEYELIKVDINSLKFDQENPNKLTTKQFDALKESLNKYGYLEPVIIDQHSNIIDGHHRALALKQLGTNTLTVYQVHTSNDTTRRLIRQVKNKIKGQHLPELDAKEYAALYEANSLDDLAKLTAQNKQDIIELLNRYYPELESKEPANQSPNQQAQQFPVNLNDIFELESGKSYLICADPTDKRIISKAISLLSNVPNNIIMVSNNYIENNISLLVHNLSPSTIVLSNYDTKPKLKLDMTTLIYNPYSTLSLLLSYNSNTPNLTSKPYYVGIHPDSKVISTQLAAYAQATKVTPITIQQ